jgi:hypothetical protein
MGKQLESLSRGLGTKIPIQIYDGKRRPEPPIQAAKFASEGGIILRQHIPIFPHWKEYKKQENEGKITDYIGKLAVSQCLHHLFNYSLLSFSIKYSKVTTFY